MLPLGFLFSAGGQLQKRSCRDFVDFAEYWHVHYPEVFVRLTEDWLGEAEGRVGEGQHACAIALYRLVTEADDRNIEAYKGLGDAYLYVGDTVAALENYRTALQLKPDDQGLRRAVEDLSNRREP